MPNEVPVVRPLQPGDPERLGGYVLAGRIGEGGYGVVFLGETGQGEKVAVKLLRSGLAGVNQERFAREVDTARQVARFCTAQVLDADVYGDRPYIVSEYVPGPSLHQHVSAQGPLSGGALERLAIGTSTALSAIHQAGIVHRDFKPHNVLMGPDGPRVIDFGIARAISPSATVSSQVVGTPAYMSPEQISAETVGPATDVFAWGSTMVFAATSGPPFGQDTIPAVAHRIMTLDPDLGDLPEPLRSLVAECLAKSPQDRPHARQLLLRLLGQDDAAAARPAADDVPTALMAEAVTRAAPVVTDDLTRRDATAVLPADGPPEPTTVDPAVPPPPTLPGVPMGGQPGYPPAKPPKRPGRRRLLIGVLAALGALLLVAGGVAAFMLADPGDDGGPGASPPPTGSGSASQPTSKPPTTRQTRTNPTNAAPTCTVSPPSINLGTTGTSGSVTLRATGAGYAWSASASGNVSVSPSSGNVSASGSSSATIHADVGDPRTDGSGSVTFSTGCGSRTVTVTWRAAVIVSPTTS